MSVNINHKMTFKLYYDRSENPEGNQICQSDFKLKQNYHV
jgi:hypothetical protein